MGAHQEPSHVQCPICARTKAEMQVPWAPPHPFMSPQTPPGRDSGLQYRCFKSHPLTRATFHLVMVCLACPQQVTREDSGSVYAITD